MLIYGGEMYSLMERLFPICRSITGDGVRETLKIINDFIPLDMHEIPSGTKVFDWTIPDEWNINDAYVKNENGTRVIDFQNSNLHLVGYSIPCEGKISLKELKNHLHTLPDQPDLIPYVTSYYDKRWGFCLAHNDLLKLKDDFYYVKIDSVLEPGHLTYADLVIDGKTEEEILISTYVCHPSMASNELSGPVVSTYLAKYLLESKDNPFYTYRFVFCPETIGSITYISQNLDHLKNNVIAGYVINCVGDPGPFSYLLTKNENNLVDRITLHALKHSNHDYNIFSYLERRSDERQYNSPGVDLPVGSLMRTKHASYPEYHTSADNLDFVTQSALNESLEMYIRCIEMIENNRTYESVTICEPQLGRRGLWPNLSIKGSSTSWRLMRDIISYSDGSNDLLYIAEKVNRPFWELYPVVDQLVKSKSSVLKLIT